MLMRAASNALASLLPCGQGALLAQMAVSLSTTLVHDPDTVFNSPSILRQTRRWKANVLKLLRPSVARCGFWYVLSHSDEGCHVFAPGILLVYWARLPPAKGHVRTNPGTSKRIAERSDIVCLQETHGRYEHPSEY